MSNVSSASGSSIATPEANDLKACCKRLVSRMLPATYPSQHALFAQRRYPGSGEWFLESKPYQTWIHAQPCTGPSPTGSLQENPLTLFCPGPAGAGKTVLATAVVGDLISRFHTSPTTDVGIASIYCVSHLRQEQLAANLLLDLLRQLLLPKAGPEKAWLKNERDGDLPPPEVVTKVLKQVISQWYTHVFLVLDAIDECDPEHRVEFLHQLFSLQTDLPIHILATSDFDPEINSMFSNSLSLQVKAADQDLVSCLEHHMAELPTFVQRESGLEEAIKTSITNAAEGRILLSELNLLSLVEKSSPEDLQIALAGLASGPDHIAYSKAYNAMMQRIESQTPDRADLAKRAVSFIAYAARPLTVSELCHALAVKPGDTMLDHRSIPDIRDVIAACGSLVLIADGVRYGSELDDAYETARVRLIHRTAYEYFQQTQEQWFPSTEGRIATACMAYLSLADFESGPSGSDNDLSDRLRTYPLYRYAAEYWGYHVRAACFDFRDLDFKILYSQPHIDSAFQALYRWKKYEIPTRYSYDAHAGFPHRMTTLHMAGYYGIVHLARSLFRADARLRALDLGVNVNTKDGYGRTALAWAACQGQEETAKVLVDAMASDLDARDFKGQTAMALAAKYGHVNVVELLLSRGASPNIKDFFKATSLWHAAKAGHAAIAALLLRRGVDANAAALDEDDNESVSDNTDVHVYTPLSLAAMHGHGEIARLLLAHKDINTRAAVSSSAFASLSPLWWAVENGHDSAHVAEMLLSRADVDPAELGKGGKTLMHKAAESSCDHIVQLLLQTDSVEADARDEDGRTPLSLAISAVGSSSPPLDAGQCTRAQDYGAVRRLLGSGRVDAHSRDLKGRTPLSYAAAAGRLPLVKLVLDCQGVDINNKDERGTTPLLEAASNGYATVVRTLLLHDGVDVNARDSFERVPLILAAQLDRPQVVEELLATGKADINAREESGQTALHKAAYDGYMACVSLLLGGNCVEPNCKDFGGRTPLSLAADRGNLDVVERLLPFEGANMGDNTGRTPLSWSVAPEELVYYDDDHKRTTERLLEGGADANAEDKNGWTPLFWAVENNRRDLIASLLDYKADPNHKDKNGLTPLVLALKMGEQVVVDKLLKARAKSRPDSRSGPNGADETQEQSSLPGTGQRQHVNLVHEAGERRPIDAEGEQGDTEALCGKCREIENNFRSNTTSRFIYSLPSIDVGSESKVCALCRLTAAVCPHDVARPIPCDVRGDFSSQDCAVMELKLYGSNRFTPIKECLLTWVFGSSHMNEQEAPVTRQVHRREGVKDFPIVYELQRTFSIDRARRWIKCCKEYHGSECNPGARQPIPHFRLFDCYKHEIIVTADPISAVSFVALSYVWGSPTKRNHKIATSSRSPPCIGNLESVVEDAVRVTKELGYRYLWVDRLCIAEDNGTIRDAQLQTMHSVYNGADVTIVAAAGDDSEFGLCGVSGTRPDRIHARAQTNNLILTAIEGNPRAIIRGSTWWTRGWTYQEGFMSRRLLVFTEHEIFYECSHLFAREAIQLPSETLVADGGGSKVQIHEKMNEGCRVFPSSLRKSDVDRFYVWGRIQEYIQRKLTFEYDTLKAMLGILGMFSELPSPVRHLCGIPILCEKAFTGDEEAPTTLEGFACGLCWRMRSPGTRREGFPSWSWTGWRGEAELPYPSIVLFENGFSIDVFMVPRDGASDAFCWADLELATSSGANLPESCYMKITATVVDVYIYNSGSEFSSWKAVLFSGNDTFGGDVSFCKDPNRDIGFSRHLVENRCLAIVLGVGGTIGHGHKEKSSVFLLLLEEVEDHWERIGVIMTDPKHQQLPDANTEWRETRTFLVK